MTKAESSTANRVMGWLALGLAAVLIVLGISWYGWSLEVRHRFWSDMFARFGGPMSFRFFLQPTMAAIAALHDGIRDAREGHKSFFWSALRDPAQRSGRLREGLTSTARIMLLGFSMDAIYQFRVLQTFYPVEMLAIAILLAVIPYFVFRWLVEIVARRRLARKGKAFS